MAGIEGENDNDISNKDELSDAFVTLLVDIKEEEIKEQYTDFYFTLVKSFFLTKSLIISYIILYIKTLINNLNN